MIYAPTDNNVMSAFEGIVKVAQQAKLPVVAADTDAVKRGAVAALGLNYYDLGRQTGKVVVRILNGEKRRQDRLAGQRDVRAAREPGRGAEAGRDAGGRAGQVGQGRRQVRASRHAASPPAPCATAHRSRPPLHGVPLHVAHRIARRDRDRPDLRTGRARRLPLVSHHQLPRPHGRRQLPARRRRRGGADRRRLEPVRRHRAWRSSPVRWPAASPPGSTCTCASCSCSPASW